MKAVVMAGGEGYRLRPLTSGIPKPLVPVVGKPVMEHILRLLRQHGVTEVIVTLQYLGSAIRDYFGDGSDFGVDITYVVEDSPLGTAGSVKNAQEYLDEPFIVISGDALTDIDLTKVMAYHREKGAAATIVLTSVANPLEFGVVITNQDGTINRFLEKPSWGEVFSDQVNTGIYVIEPSVLDLLPPATGATSETSRPTTRRTGMRSRAGSTSRSQVSAGMATSGWGRTSKSDWAFGSKALPTSATIARSRRASSSMGRCASGTSPSWT